MRKLPKQKKGLIDFGQHRRILLIMAVLGIISFFPIALQLYGLMVLKYDHYASLALRNQSRTTLVTADRGNIYDRNMNVLASSVSAPNVYLNPRELRQAKADIPAMADALGKILGKDPQWIREKAENRSLRYEQIGKYVEPEQAEKIRAYILESGIRGIHMEPGSRRTYPYGSLASQVIGFTDASLQGVEGAELAWDPYLRGEKGKVITTRGNNEMDMPFSYERYSGAHPGGNLVLTLDTAVQQCLENQLSAAMDRYQVKNGAFGMVMNCKTGEILAMATLGGFDPNDYQKLSDPAARAKLEEMKKALEAIPENSEAWEKGKKEFEAFRSAAQLKQWRNRVISDGYEPGSTFKVLTMAAALDCGAIDLNTNFYCRGAEQIPGRAQKLHCWRHQGHGAEKTPQALQNSCNIAFAHIALALGGERFYDYVQRFGILEKTGIDLKGESKGVFFQKPLITDTEKWGTASLTSGSFGQTFKLTPLQLVRGIASVVNGGKLLKPYIVSQVLDENGDPVYTRKPEVIRRTISPETSGTMCRLIRSVVESGTARNAAVEGYSVGGKTGTSEKIDVFDENGNRVLDKIVSFVGIAPMEDPEYIVLAALDTPSRNCGTYLSGGAMAAPTVGAILRDLLPYLEVSGEPGADSSEKTENLIGLSKGEAMKKLEAKKILPICQGEEEKVTAQIPLPGQSLPRGSQMLLYFGKPPEDAATKVPNLLKLNRQQASDLAGSLGFFIAPTGNPEISPQVISVSQNPEPGTLAPAGTTITIQFTDTTVRD